MGNEHHTPPHHVCKSANVEFTRDQWSTYCRQHPHGDETVATSHGFNWNIHDVCLNPKITVIIVNDEADLEITTAQRPDGRWVYGWRYHGIMTEPTNGGGSPVMFDAKDSFETSEDAIKSVLKYFLQGKNLAPKYRAEIQTELNKRRVVQLTLF